MVTLELWGVRNRRLGGFSGGMKQGKIIADKVMGYDTIVDEGLEEMYMRLFGYDEG